MLSQLLQISRCSCPAASKRLYFLLVVHHLPLAYPFLVLLQRSVGLGWDGGQDALYYVLFIAKHSVTPYSWPDVSLSVNHYLLEIESSQIWLERCIDLWV